MRLPLAVQVVIFLLFAAFLMYAVFTVAHGWASWVVFGVIVMAAFGGAVAANNRRFLPQGKKRGYTRDSDSRW